MIRLLLAEDQALVRGALRALLELEDDLTVVAEAATGAEAVALAETTRPDVCILDVEMPEMDGLNAAARIRVAVPESRLVILTTFARPGYLTRALAAGCRGYLLKSSPAADLARAIRRIQSGSRVIDPELAAEAISTPNPLSEREQKVLRLADSGLTSAGIADTLALAEGTVRNYLSSAMSKLGVDRRADAAQVAREKGWI